MTADKEVYALFIHGIGSQDQRYADYARKKLRAALADRGMKFYARSVHWSPILDVHEKQLLENVKKHGSDARLLQRQSVMTLADALSYKYSQEQINNLIWYELNELGPTKPVYIFCHSLGVVLATDYLRAYPQQRVAKFVSMGTNLALFFGGDPSRFACPVQLKGANKWLNLFSPSDAIGFPLRGFQPQVQDVEVNVGPWYAKIIPGATHVGYLENSRLWGKTIPRHLWPKAPRP